MINEEGIHSGVYSFRKKLYVPNTTAIDHKILVQDDEWMAKIVVNRLRVGEQSATIDFRALNCGGYLTFIQEENNGFTFDETITYGNCVQNCQVWINYNGTYYTETCGSHVEEGILHTVQE